jgi:hypothetical protein
VWGSEFTSKDDALQRGVIVVLRPLFAAALVVRRRYFIFAKAVSRGAARCASQVLDRGAQPIPAAPRM